MEQPARLDNGLPDNQVLLREFDELLSGEDYSPNTRDAYLRFVRPFLTDRPSPENLDRYDVGRFLLEWRNRLSAGSLRLATSALIKFYKFLKFYHGYRNADTVINHIKDLKGEFFHTRTFQPDPLSEKEIMSLYQYTLGRNQRSQRRRCILTVLLGTGLRVSEFCNLTQEQITIHEPGTPSHISIPSGKTASARRKIPLHRNFEFSNKWILGERVIDALDQYKKVRPKSRGTHENNYWFISERGTPLSTRSVQSMITRLAKKSGLQEKRSSNNKSTISVHNLRHSFATILARQGASAYQIKSILGHASVSTSQAYIRFIERVG
ncbi:MAG: tyrosine-type recombinase/integrase [bacterium]